MSKDYLVHHGILGQKWGVRRYQNPDGSLTPAGQKRYSKELSKRNIDSAPSWVNNSGIESNGDVHNVRYLPSWHDAKQKYSDYHNSKYNKEIRKYYKTHPEDSYKLDDSNFYYDLEKKYSPEVAQAMKTEMIHLANEFFHVETKLINEMLGKYGDVHTISMARNGIRQAMKDEMNRESKKK